MKKWLNKDGNFVKLSAEDVNSLEADELKEYSLALMKDSVAKEIEKLKLVDKSQFEKLQKELEELKKSQDNEEFKANFKGLQNTVKSLKSALNNKNEPEKLTIESQVEKIAKEQFKDLKDFDANKIKIRIKAASSLTNAITDNTMSYRIPGITPTPSPRFVMTEFFPTVNVTDPNSFDELTYTDWDESAIVRNTAVIGEGDDVPESQLVMIEKKVELKYIADSFSITRPARSNARIFARDLGFFLDDNMNRVVNQELLTGDGTGNHPDGLYHRAPTFNYAGYSGRKIADANVRDLCYILKKEIMTGKSGKNGINVDFAFVTWDDYMDLSGGLKDANGNYIVPPMNGITYIPVADLDDNTLVVGDSRKAKIYQTLGYDYEVGYKSGNFEKRIQSTIVETAKQFLIRNMDLQAFLKVTDVEAAKIAVSA